MTTARMLPADLPARTLRPRGAGELRHFFLAANASFFQTLKKRGVTYAAYHSHNAQPRTRRRALRGRPTCRKPLISTARLA
ncbi:protein of unknown function [Paraburkholderia dioscoreae]|uniref:Uncharacterized protein n=1 Tax=Paraburkholderia dioscoreae TaxID=2604047 RepID=A0A5Q4ZDX6_9BURK|nr:protein of unknown function [Paraburkholderia dioscoreae]